MPNYPYICLKCEAEAEEIRHVDDRDKEKLCSECGAAMMRQRVYPFVNDYRPTHSRFVRTIDDDV